MSTLPGIAPSGPPDEQSWGRDLATIFTNPSLLLGAAGVLAPEEVNVGGNRYWRIAPRLRGLSQLFGASREANMQDQYANELAGLNRLPQPPPGAGDSEPPALPPGMDRATYMSKLSRGMIRQMGNNPLAWRQVDTFSNAQEGAAKQKAKYDIAYNQLVAMGHDPVKARTLALGMARENRDLSEPFATATPQALQATGIEGDLRLQQAKQEQKIQQALSGGLSTADYATQKAWLQQNPDVDPTKFFGTTGSIENMFTHATEGAAARNAELKRTKGTQIDWIIAHKPDKKQMEVQAVERPAQESQEQVQQGLMGLTEMLNILHKQGLVTDQQAAPIMMVVKGAMNSGDPKAYDRANALITGLYEVQMRTRESQSMMAQRVIETISQDVNGRIAAIDKQLQLPQYQNLNNESEARRNPQWVRGYINLQQDKEKLQLTLQQIRVAPSPEAAQAAYAKMAPAGTADTYLDLMRAGGKKWADIEKTLIKQNPKITPEELNQQRRAFMTQAKPIGQ